MGLGNPRVKEHPPLLLDGEQPPWIDPPLGERLSPFRGAPLHLEGTGQRRSVQVPGLVEIEADLVLEEESQLEMDGGRAGVEEESPVAKQIDAVLGAFSFVGGSGEKKYIDSTIPAGTPQVQYQVRGIRSTGAGDWAQHNVNFGQPGSASDPTTAGAAVAKPAPKLAA